MPDTKMGALEAAECKIILESALYITVFITTYTVLNRAFKRISIKKSKAYPPLLGSMVA